MNANFRRSGRIIYQPTCASCRQCQSLRVLTGRISDEQVATSLLAKELGCCRDGRIRRCRRRRSLRSIAGILANGMGGMIQPTMSSAISFIDSPVQTLEFEYRDASARLLAIGICDRSQESLSSVYFYFDTSECNRSLGTFGALWEIRWATQNDIPYYYLGYWVSQCAAMRYKASFHPHELLGTDGVWRTPAEIARGHPGP